MYHHGCEERTTELENRVVDRGVGARRRIRRADAKDPLEGRDRQQVETVSCPGPPPNAVDLVLF